MSQAAIVKDQQTSKVKIDRLGLNIAAEVKGLDLTRPLSAGEVTALEHALADHEVLIFRDQDITPQQQLDFGKCFGAPSVHPFSPNPTGMQELIVLDNHRDNPPKLTDIWHSDETFRSTPPMATILRGTIVPKIGGDTLFASMTAAYDGLSDGLQQFISGLEALHDFKPFRTLFDESPESKKRLRAMEDDYPLQAHPVVRVHPVSGRKTIFVNPQFAIRIKGMKEDESRNLLNLLFDQAKIPEYQYRLKWQRNTMVMWDNRAALHYASHDYHPQRRRMERITIAGDAPFDVNAPFTGTAIPRQPLPTSAQDEPPADTGPGDWATNRDWAPPVKN